MTKEEWVCQTLDAIDNLQATINIDTCTFTLSDDEIRAREIVSQLSIASMRTVWIVFREIANKWHSDQEKQIWRLADQKGDSSAP